MLPATVLVNVLGSLKRRDLDVLELVDRAFGAAIATHENHLAMRSLSLTFFNAGSVSLISFRDTMKHVPVVELPRYLQHSVVTKMLFRVRSAREHSLTEEMYQALLACRAHYTADAVCDFRSLSVFHPDILQRAFTEVFMCATLVFAEPTSKAMDVLRRYSDGLVLAALPCLANCANLQIDYYDETLFDFDANGALEWLLGTHAAAAGVKHLSIGEIDTNYWRVFLIALVVAIEQQFVHATTPASFNVELCCTFKHPPGPDVGITRALENAGTNEQLEVVVDTSKAFKTTVTIHRKSAA